MSEDPNNQQIYFDELCKNIHPTTIKVANNFFDSKIGAYVPGRRYKPDKYKLHDERMVAINEIVFELDWKSYRRNYQEGNKIIEVLDNYGIDSLICASGGKGIHIHIFFNKLNFKTDKQKDIFNEALSYGFGYKAIRIWFLKKICAEAGIDEKYIGGGKYVDTKPITFNYFAGSTHLIRDVGGKKYVKNVEDTWDVHYKTWIPKDEFDHKKVTITEFKNVKFPPSVPTFDIDVLDLCEYLSNYIKFQKDHNIKQNKNIKFDGIYTEIDGILRIREGMPEGKRSSGSSVLAVACKIDDLSMNEATKIMEEYVKNCSQIGTSFVLSEATNWLNWIYAHDKPFWNCSLLVDLGVHDTATCNYCQARNKEALKILTKSDLLDKIKEVLDESVVGEDHTKMLIFLLSLSKDFPSKTGRPGWNILSDPMSQNVIVSADSSSGKSWVVKAVLELFGEKETDYFIMSRITKSALNYFTDINMDGKVIFIEEMQGLDEHTEQLRVWMSEGSLNLTTVESVKQDDGTEIKEKVTKITKGHPVFITNQAEGKVETQLNNRSWLLSTDVSGIQTQSILDFQDDVFQGVHISSDIKKRKIVDALRQLKPYHFIVPYASNKAMDIPVTDVRSRRDYKKFITLIQCSAYLHQKQREITVDEEGREYVVCSIQDYEIAKQYSSDILGATFCGLTNSQIDIINLIKQMSWKDEFTINHLMRNFNKSQSHWYGIMSQLVDLGFVFETERGGRGSPTTYALNMDKALNIISLPSGEELIKRIAEQNSSSRPKKDSIPDEEQKLKPVGSSTQKLVSGFAKFEKKVTKSKSSSERNGSNMEAEDDRNFVKKTVPGTNSKDTKTASSGNSDGTAMPVELDSGTKLLIKSQNIISEKSFSDEESFICKNLPGKKIIPAVEIRDSHNNQSGSDSTNKEYNKSVVPTEEQKLVKFLRNQKGKAIDSLSIIKHLKVDTDDAYELINNMIRKGDIFETRPDMYILLE